MIYVQIVGGIVNLIGDESVGLSKYVQKSMENNPNVIILERNLFTCPIEEGYYYQEGVFYSPEEWMQKMKSEQVINS